VVQLNSVGDFFLQPFVPFSLSTRQGCFYAEAFPNTERRVIYLLSVFLLTR